MSIFDDLISKFADIFSLAPVSAEKKQIRLIKKRLRKSRFNFYRLRTNEVDPNFAKFLYQIYRFTGPLHSILERYDSSDVVKQILVDRALPKDALKLKETFTEDAIRTFFQTNNSQVVVNQLKKSFTAFKKSITKADAIKINQNYADLMSFVAFVKFDLFYILRKFDSRFPELDFVYRPKFDPIVAAKLSEDLKDFLSIIYSINPYANWNEIFNFVNDYQGGEIVKQATWRKVLRSIEDVKKSKIIEMMISVIDDDPNFRIKESIKAENIVGAYLDNEGKQLQKNLKLIISEKKDGNINEIVKKIFGKTPPNRVKNYNDKINKLILTKVETGFTYYGAINYLKSFYLDILKKEIREVANVFLIRGKWFSTSTNQGFSDYFHKLLELSDELLEFDNSMDEKYRRGAAIKTYTKLSDRDKTGTAILERIVKEINEEAKQICVESAQTLINLARIIKALIEDHGKKTHTIVHNWKELEQAYKGDLTKDCVAVYRKIYDVVKLLQLYVA